MKKLSVIPPTVVIALLFHIVVLAAEWPGDSGTLIGDSTSLGSGYEPSDLVWHSGRQQLIMVGDDGDVSTMSSDGSDVTSWNVGGDLEGITVLDSSTSLVYVGVEHPDSIREFDLDSGAFTGNTWDLTTWMIGSDNAGLEALTFVPNGSHPYESSTSGGVFYAGLQEDGLVYVFDVDTSSAETVSFLGTIEVAAGVTDVSGLSYSTETKTLYALFDGANVLVETDAAGTAMASYTAPGNDQEGVAVVSDCTAGFASVYIAEDVGPEVWRYDSYPIVCVVEEVEEEAPVEEETPPVEETPVEETPNDDTSVETPSDDTGETETEVDEESDEDPVQDTPEETESDDVVGAEEEVYTTAVSVHKRKIRITLSDGSSVTRTPFKKGKVRAKKTTDGSYVVATNGRRVCIYEDGNLLQRNLLRKRVPRLAALRVRTTDERVVIAIASVGHHVGVVARVTISDDISIKKKNVRFDERIDHVTIKKNRKKKTTVQFGKRIIRLL